MKKNISTIVACVALTSLSWFSVVNMTPYVIYGKAKSRMQASLGDRPNQLLFTPRVDHTSRAVVMPNPDFLYTLAFYDLSNGPLFIEGPIPEDMYSSVAFYEPNTVNWYVKNDQQRKQPYLRMVLRTSDQSCPCQVGNGEIPWEEVISPGPKGNLLIRYLLSDQEMHTYQKIDSIRRLLKMTPG